MPSFIFTVSDKRKRNIYTGIVCSLSTNLLEGCFRIPDFWKCQQL